MNDDAEEIEATWLAEAERRREELRSGRTQTVPWPDVRREMFEMVECFRVGEHAGRKKPVGHE